MQTQIISVLMQKTLSALSLFEKNNRIRLHPDFILGTFWCTAGHAVRWQAAAASRLTGRFWDFFCVWLKFSATKPNEQISRSCDYVRKCFFKVRKPQVDLMLAVSEAFVSKSYTKRVSELPQFSEIVILLVRNARWMTNTRSVGSTQTSPYHALQPDLSHIWGAGPVTSESRTPFPSSSFVRDSPNMTMPARSESLKSRRSLRIYSSVWH